VIANSRSWALEHIKTFSGDEYHGPSGQLKIFVLGTMKDCDANEELLLIGSFRDVNGKVRKHASTFIRIECGRNKTPVVVHLDSNCDKPQSTDPQLINTMRANDLLDWDQFNRYFEIMLFTLEGSLLYDNTAFKKAIDFAKEIIEGRSSATPAIADNSSMRDEMSARGSRGKQASAKSSLKLTSRPKKS